MKAVENEIRANWKQLPAHTKKNMPSLSGKTGGSDYFTSSVGKILLLEKQGQLERFENIGRNGDEETEVDSFGTYEYNVQRIWQSFTNSAFRFTGRSDHIFIALSLVVSLNNILRFPVICSESGGILFLIPYGLCLIFITMPIIYLENALGQYSSLPPMQLFHHLCPAFGGIGLAMSLVAISKSILLSYSAMGIFYAFKSMTAAVSTLSQTNWLECVHQSYSSCYDPYVKCNEAAGSYQHYSKCYNLQVFDNRSSLNYTWEQVVILMTSTSEALREFPPNIYWMEKINKPGKPSEFFFASATAEQAIIAIIAMLGMRFYAKIARLLVTLPQLCMIICIIFATVKIGFRNTIASIAKGFSPDREEFFDLRVWVTAALQAMVATNLLDGSYITLAAMKDFRNNFMR
uniref:Amino acid transporter transmembrane domain-containing protein n=1 Tax=Setaria digitata TaxID=48799 RepID=A0A915PSY1_9BILA